MSCAASLWYAPRSPAPAAGCRRRRCRHELLPPCCCLPPVQPPPSTLLRRPRQASSGESQSQRDDVRGAATKALAALCAAVTVLSAADEGAAITDNQLLFLEAWRAVDRAYVDKTFNGQTWFRYREQAVKTTRMDSKQDTYGAIRTMLATLNDPFTRFLDPDQFAALQGATTGELTGVGLEIAPGKAQAGKEPVVVVAPAAGGPADRAGLRPGDTLVSVDDVALDGLSVYEAAALLQGPDGTGVTVTYLPAGKQAPKSVLLTRQAIKVLAVSSAVCPAVAPGADPVGYIRVSAFNATTPAGVRAALKAVVGEGGAKSLVLDLRSNGGGSFPAAVDVGRMLIPKGVVVYIADSTGVRDIFEAGEDPAQLAVSPAVPMVALVNKGTASAAEVLAAALHDDRRARLVGEQTFGKGIIQTTVPLSDGSAVNVTVAKYQTPSGTDINKVGITPDGPSPLADGPSTPQAFCTALTPGAAAELFPAN